MCLAVPGQVVSVAGEGLARSARVDFAGVVRDVSLACLPEASPGDYVIVHAGIALSMVDAAAAAETLELLGEAE
jgi:hydrogenase expression/formation protein HypC